jgi:predicted ATPase
MRRILLPLESFRLKNFKAVRDSEIVKFTPLTVFIGNNGSGKSSLVEGLEMIQSIVNIGLDQALLPWHGFEYILNMATPRRRQAARSVLTNPMAFDLRGNYDRKPFTYHLAIGAEQGTGDVLIEEESYRLKGTLEFERSSLGRATVKDLDLETSVPEIFVPVDNDESVLSKLSIRSILPIPSFHNILDWQFLSLTPQMMGSPVPQRRASQKIRLAKDGSNIAEYLLSIRRLDAEKGTSVVDGIVEALQYVLPYARDMQPTLTSELERTIYLQLTEEHFKLPGWLLSTGTLRILALLALLRHPSPPPLLVVEEIENGLDPRTIHLLIEEIRDAVESGRTQVIVTTHSPYLLDLLTLSHIIIVEREDSGSPIFTRPDDNDALKEWTEKFTPGQLYTMSRLGRRSTS